MFKAVFITQLRWSRLAVAVTAIAAFALPLLTIQGTGMVDPAAWQVTDMLDHIRGWSAVYPILAAAVGLVFATTAWSADHRTNHVYALSLPLPRWHLVLLRFAAGASLLAIPVFALWIGSLVASTAAVIPQGLHAYPNTLALRFLLSSLVAYAVFFAISAGTTRTAGYVLAIIAGLLLVQFVLAAGETDVDVVSPVADRLVSLGGPFEVFTGRWMLIDV